MLIATQVIPLMWPQYNFQDPPNSVHAFDISFKSLVKTIKRFNSKPEHTSQDCKCLLERQRESLGISLHRQGLLGYAQVLFILAQPTFVCFTKEFLSSDLLLGYIQAPPKYGTATSTICPLPLFERKAARKEL